MSHTCHALGCTKEVPPRMLMCAPHWRSLRRPMQHAIWREYAEGQEDRKDPSLRYLAVQSHAVYEVAVIDRQDSARQLRVANRLRKECIAEGFGDPLLDEVPVVPS